jgi:hypothetical protein
MGRAGFEPATYGERLAGAGVPTGGGGDRGADRPARRAGGVPSRLKRDPQVEALVAAHRADLKPAGQYAESEVTSPARSFLLRVGVEGWSRLSLDEQCSIQPPDSRLVLSPIATGRLRGTPEYRLGDQSFVVEVDRHRVGKHDGPRAVHHKSDLLRPGRRRSTQPRCLLMTSFPILAPSPLAMPAVEGRRPGVAAGPSFTGSKPSALWLPDLPALSVELVFRERVLVCVTKRSKGLRTRLLPGGIHVPGSLAPRIGRITKRVMRKRLLIGAVEGFHDRVNGRPRNGRESK